MEYDFETGNQLIVELITKEIFEGEYVSGSKNRIELKQVCDYVTRNTLGGMLFTFYRSEISNIRLLEESVRQPCRNASPKPHRGDIISLPQSEYQSLKELSDNYIYMSTMDNRYFKAVKHLNACENIGVVALSSHLGRAAPLNLLVCCTWDQVYIFDLLLYNKKSFPKELKQVMESNDIKKVLHDSRAFVDCLRYCYRLTVCNIFDTQVADVLIEKKFNRVPEKTRNLGECLTEHFNFPKYLLERALSVDLSLWKKRPLNDTIKLMASSLAVYLITLKNHLEKLLLKEFYDEVNTYSTSTLHKSAVEAQSILSNNDVAEVLSSLTLTGNDEPD